MESLPIDPAGIPEEEAATFCGRFRVGTIAAAVE